MKKLINKLNSKLLSAQLAVRNFVSNERGDTNFVSIAIILVVVIVIAIVFISLGGKLGAALKTKVQDLLDALGI